MKTVARMFRTAWKDTSRNEQFAKDSRERAYREQAIYNSIPAIGQKSY